MKNRKRRIEDTMDGILILSFGTARYENREKTIDRLVEECQEKFQEIPVYLAFTGKGILKRIYEKEGIQIDTAEEALKRMYLEKITRVFILPVYMVNDEISALIEKYQLFFREGIYVGKALLSTDVFHSLLLGALKEELEKNVSRETNSKVVFLAGHGREGSRNPAYTAFDSFLKKQGYENVYVGTLKGEPGIDTLLAVIAKKKIKKVVLIPFMFYAGEHMIEDIAGNKKDSWRSMLEHAGYETECLFQGLGENKKIRECYIRQLEDLLKKGNGIEAEDIYTGDRKN